LNARREAETTSGSMPNWLARRAAISADVTAIKWEGREVTFGELSERVDDLGRRLTALGVAPRVRVGLLLSAGLGFAECLHAVTRCGAASVPLNTRLLPSNLSEQAEAAGVSCVVYDETFRAAGRALESREDPPEEREVELGNGLWLRQLASAPAAQPAGLRDEVELQDVHSIVFTSGTTGAGKAVELSHGNHWWNAMGSMLNLGSYESDRWLLCLPHYHVGGLSILLRSVIYGVPVLIQPGFDAEEVNRALDTEGITIVSVVSTMLRRMLGARDYLRYPEELRCVMLGGGPVPMPLLERCVEAGIPVAPTYGLSETSSQAATLHPREVARKMGSSGRALFPVDIAIDKDGERLPPGEAGEIIVRGPSVSDAYAGREAEDWRERWLYTGDAGFLDEEGYLYVLDRQDDLIISGGEKVYPSEVESVLTAHPDVEEAGVFGGQDEEWGQAVNAAIVPRAGCTPSLPELQRYCRERLAGYKIPRGMYVVDSLPRTASGKLQRKVLREEHEGRT
jgi:O-succinylbenzoic acid--CoA ligase